MIDLTGLATLGLQVSDDVMKEITAITSELMAERKILRQQRIMNKLIDRVKLLCVQYVRVPVQTFVAAMCGTLAPEVQADITTIITDELNRTDPAQQKETTEPCSAVNPVSSNNQNKIQKMETGTALLESELALATAAGKATKTIGLFIKKGDAFITATLDGVKSVPDTQVVTIKNIIDQAFTVLGLIAIVTGLKAFIQLSIIAKYFYDDCANGSASLIQIIRALIQSKPAIKAALAEAGARQPDPNLTSDELSIATGMGALVKMLAIFLGKDKATAFTDAFMEGAASEPDNAAPVVKDVVDDSFGILLCIAAIINYAALTVAIQTVQTLYDDFAGSKTGLLGLYEEMVKAKAKIA